MDTRKITTAEGDDIHHEFPFDLDPSIDAYKLTYKRYLQEYPFFEIAGPDHIKVAISWIIVGALTFHPTANCSNPPRILLVQRSATDSMPLRWEIPGGSCDETDESILHSLARELKEETGLCPRRIGPEVGRGYIFNLGSGRVTRKVNFIVELGSVAGAPEGEMNAIDVKLDPNEHQAFVWATEKQVLTNRVDNSDIIFTSDSQKDVILEAFEVRRLEESRREENVMV